MVAIPAGTYRPLVPASPDKTKVAVPAFRIDRVAVTNADFLRFVREHGEWSKGRVTSTFAEAGYLAHWETADVLGAHAAVDRPVVNVSWFAARAYCVSRGQRLPSEAEWERVAAASRKAADGSSDATWRAELLATYSKPAAGTLPRAGAGAPNFWGVSDLHGVGDAVRALAPELRDPAPIVHERERCRRRSRLHRIGVRTHNQREEGERRCSIPERGWRSTRKRWASWWLSPSARR